MPRLKSHLLKVWLFAGIFISSLLAVYPQTQAASSGIGEPVRSLRGELVVKIPGQFASLQEAIDELSGTLLPHQGAKIILEIESGHHPATGIVVENGDFGHFWIRSEDEVVAVSDDFEGDFMRGTYSRLPVLDCLVDMRGLGEDGVHIRESSSARIMPGAGIKNAGANGVFGWTSSIYMERAIVTGSAIDNLRISTSHAHARFTDLSGAGRNNVRASYGSSVRVTFANLSNAGARGVYAVRSRIIAEASDITNAGEYAVFANRGSTVHLTFNHSQTDLSGAGNRGIFATSSSIVDARGVKIHDAKNEGVLAQQNASITLRESDIQNCGQAIVATLGARVDIENGIAKNSRNGPDLVVIDGGTIFALGTETTQGKPSLADTNVTAFRVIEANGTVFD